MAVLGNFRLLSVVLLSPLKPRNQNLRHLYRIDVWLPSNTNPLVKIYGKLGANNKKRVCRFKIYWSFSEIILDLFLHTCMIVWAKVLIGLSFCFVGFMLVINCALVHSNESNIFQKSFTSCCNKLCNVRVRF